MNPFRSLRNALRRKTEMTEECDSHLRMALIGMAIGTMASFVAARAISSKLFGTEPTDPMTFAGMIVVLTFVAFVAGYLPALRASRINPMVALRSN